MLDALKAFFTPVPALQARALPEPDVAGSLNDFIHRLQGSRTVPYRLPSTGDAMAVPAIFRSVTLLSNLIGSMAMRAFRDGLELPVADRPRLIVRPDPNTTPREFYRQTGYSLARYGEAWWYVAKRDSDGNAISLVAIHPREVMVTENQRNRLFPRIEWNGETWSRDELRQIKMTGDVMALRGEGPLQRCQVAASIAVEAQEYAANFFAYPYPSTVIKLATPMNDEEAGAFKSQYISDVGTNSPVVADPGVIDEIKELSPNIEASQAIGARDWQNGDAARMFGIPGKLLEFVSQGSSLTYQNIGQVFDDLLRTTLGPDYLEPIEQEMSDLLPRSTTAEFNRAELLKPDMLTAMNVATIGYGDPTKGGGILDRDEARAIVGFTPDIENAAVPFSPPIAFPDAIQVRSIPEPGRCDGKRLRQGRMVLCNRLLAERGPFYGRCPRCKKEYEPLAA